MTITAEIIADSISNENIRITTFQLRYPRFIHAELMTHRVFSRNASSSRAVPVEKLIADIERDPAMPVHWGKNQKGMQANEELDQWNKGRAHIFWLTAMKLAIHSAKNLIEAGAHKQIVNRILEPFSHINVVLTSTYWANWYGLRNHEDAQPEIRLLAQRMQDAQTLSKPVLLQPGEWHLPYIKANDWEIAYQTLRSQHPDTDEILGYQIRDVLLKVSTARCARVSYLTHDGRETTLEEDFALYERLMERAPLHASPAEHQATPDFYQHNDMHKDNLVEGWKKSNHWGNFYGWIQHRKLLPNEFIND